MCVRVCVHVYVKHREYMSERESVCVCVTERERESVCVCVCVCAALPQFASVPSSFQSVQQDGL